MGKDTSKDYKADSIKALEGLEAVRLRPGMYIGDTGVRGMHHLVYEVVDNCIDEVMGGHASRVVITLNSDNSVTVVDDGRGIPVDWHKDQKMSALTVVMTKLHAGGKFEGTAYKVSGGLHGVGVSVVNALSEWLEAEVYRDGKIHFQRFERGLPVGAVEEHGNSTRTGTKIVFKPDAEIFKDVDELSFDYDTLANRMQELAFLNKGASITIDDERKEDHSNTYLYQGGIRAFVEHLNQNKTLIHQDVIYIEKNDPDSNTETEVALQYNDGYSENVLSFANNINTHEGGTHLSGFRSAITRCINVWGKKNNVIKDDALQGDDCREGISAVVSVRLTNPQFEGQTKTKLGNREVQGLVETAVNEGLSEYFEEHPGIARNIVNRAFQAASARMAARKARDLARRKNALSGTDMPGKLADCISRDRESTEVYLVEGDSAGGSAKVGRDNRTQAILPLKGKILNVEKHRLDKVLENKEISSIVSALGTGIGREEFDIEKLRYGKIIIMTDADVDGSHIRTLILTFFYRHMKDLITNGNIYIAQPPLYRVTRRKKTDYVLTDEEMNKKLLSLGTEGTQLVYRNNGASIEIKGADLSQLLDDMSKLERLVRAVSKRNISIKRYIEIRSEFGSFPKYRVELDEQEHFFSDDAELKSFIRAEEQKAPLEVLEEEFEFKTSIKTENGESEEQEEGEESAEKKRVMHLRDYFFYKDIEKIAKFLEKIGFSMNDYLPPADPGIEGKFFLICGNDEICVRSLAEVLDGMRRMGRKGLDIQRYKGLGEMNPGQLWETTMDPDRRTLLQVTIGSAADADNLFTTLMGELVEPRREFIEKHSADVVNLDA
ncbi:MAG: DNA topoisomerase (ATP-hydrolyzing) subunit B [Planctomycetes bacterium]|nr:DNA topoisomerase (ATP-hydrolyzing) subunit B [Planctomycetota bacterium]